MMQPYHAPPFDSPVTSDSPRATLSALEKAIAAATSEAKQAEVTLVAPACDGHPIVYVGDGTACHEAASPSAGGQPALGVDLGGTTIRVEADLGRTLSPVVGYHGATPSLGGLPSTMDPGAADLGIAPEESAVTAAVEETRDDPGVEFVGATISGRSGVATDAYAICEVGGFGERKLYYYADVTTSDAPVEVTCSVDPDFVLKVSPTRAIVLHSVNTQQGGVTKLLVIDSGVETGSYLLDAFDTSSGVSGGSGSILWFAISTDGNSLATMGNRWEYVSGLSADDNRLVMVHITGLLGAVADIQETWVYADSLLEISDFGLDYGHDGTVWLSGKPGATTYALLRWLAPYTSPPVAYATETLYVAPFYIPYYLRVVISPDGQWICGTTGANHTYVYSLAGSSRTELDLDGHTNSYYTPCFLSDGTLLLAANDGSTVRVLVYPKPYNTAPSQVIDVGTGLDGGTGPVASRMSVAADDSIAIISADDVDYGFWIVSAPFEAGATVAHKAPPDGTVYWVTCPTLIGYAGASGLTLTAAVQSMTPTGDGFQVVTRLSWGGSADAFDITVTCPVPEGVTFVSATDGGTYDSDTRVVTWFLGTKTGGSSGYVELTTEVA